MASENAAVVQGRHRVSNLTENSGLGGCVSCTPRHFTPGWRPGPCPSTNRSPAWADGEPESAPAVGIRSPNPDPVTPATAAAAV